MPTILIVDDSPSDSRLTGMLLQKELDVDLIYAADGVEAVDLLGRKPIELVLTDLMMPRMDGLRLVEHIRANHPKVLSILMTAHGSEEIAMKALQRGAAGYVPKRILGRDLVHSVEGLLDVHYAERQQQRIQKYLRQVESEYVLDNDVSLVAPLVGSVEKELGQWGLCDATDLIRVCIAFREALLNAMIHGNLEVSSELKEQGDHQFDEMIARRRGEDPYRQRRVFVRIRQSAQEVEFVIRDEGPGFDPAKLPDPTDPERIAQASGRGLLLIHTFMDDVRHACNGREIVMSKRAGVSRSECGLGITPRE